MKNNIVDIQFQDGTVVKNQSYTKFCIGQVHYTIMDYTGLSGTDKYGNHFTIMRYNIKESDLGISLYKLANRQR